MADVLPEGFEPDPEGFEPDATPEGFEADPDGFEADVPAEAPGPDLIQTAHKLGMSEQPEQSVKNWLTANKLGVPLRVVELDPQGWATTATQAAFEPKVWRRNHSDLADIIDATPEAAPMVMATKEKGLLQKLFNTITDFVTEPIKPTKFGDAASKSKRDAYLAEIERINALGDKAGAFDLLNKGALENELATQALVGESALPETEALAAYSESQAGFEAAQAKRDAPNVVTEKLDAEAQQLRGDESVVGRARILGKRIEETAAGLDVSRKSFGLMVARHGSDAARISKAEEELSEAEQAAVPRAFGEDATGQALADMAQGAVSMAGVLKDAGPLAALGFVVGGVAGGAVGKTPAAAAAGGRIGAGLAGKTGAANASFVFEAGDAYKELGELKTDQGHRLTEDERAGAAVAIGIVSAGLEMMELRAVAKTFGIGIANPISPEQIRVKTKQLLFADPQFRALAARTARQYFKSTLENGSGEAAQEAAHEIGAWLIGTAHEGEAQRRIVDREKILEAGSKGVLGAAFTGGVGTASQLVNAAARNVVDTAARRVEVDRATHGAKQVGAILKMSQNETLSAIAPQVAQQIKDKTAAAGAPVTSLHVKGEALQRYFQERTPDEAQAEMVAALGEDGPARVAEAIATGGSLEVPVAAVLETYGKSEMAKALAEDTATQAGHLTPRELQAGGAERIETEAKRLALEETNRTAEQVQVNTYRQQLEQEATAAGATKAQARAAGALFQAFYETAAKDTNSTPSEVFAKYRVQIGKGDELPANAELAPADMPASSLEIDAYFETADETKRAADLYRDDVSGLRNRVAHDAEYQNGPVGLLTLHDVKPVNDHEQGGHDKANELLSRVAAAVATVAPDAVRGGTNFILKPEQLEAAQKAAEAVLPKGMRLVGATAENLKAAFGALDATAKAMREAGTLPARGSTEADLSNLANENFASPPTATAITEAELARAKSMAPEQLKIATFYDHSRKTGVRGMLSKVGFDRTPPKAFVLALDLRLLKLISDKYGEPFGDLMLRLFGEHAMSQGGADIYFAHLSGDEYAAKSDDRAQLEEFTARLEAALRAEPIVVSVAGEVVEIAPRFRQGIGEKTYGAADRVLNAAKRDEAQRLGPVTKEEDDLRRTGGLSLYEPRGRNQTPVAPVQAKTSDAADSGGAGADAAGNQRGDVTEEDTSFDPAALDAEQAAADAEQAAADAAADKKMRLDAIVFVDRIKLPEKKAKARAFLAFVLGRAERPTGDLAVTRELEKAFARFNLVDPEGFAFDENGKDLSVVRKGRKKTQAQPEALRRYTNTGVGGQYDQFRPSARLYQEFTSDKTTASEAGFHSPNAFGKEGTPENAIANDMLEELAALPAEELTSEKIRETWSEMELMGGAPALQTLRALRAGRSKHREATLSDANRNAGYSTANALRTEAMGLDDDVEDLTYPSDPGNSREAEIFWKQIEKAVRLALKGDRTLLYALDPENPAPRGYTVLPETRATEQVIGNFLNKSADRSTLFHEMAHGFLYMLEQMGLESGASERSKRIYTDARKALGVEDGKSIEREHHERFANTFVRYLEKGEAPSAELASTFRRFIKWLKGIYNLVRGTPQDLNPELVAVFDAMLATDEAIAAYKKDHGPEVFADAKAAGLTPEQWLDQKLADEELVDEGSQGAQLAVLKDMQRMSERWWKKELKERTKKAAAEWETLPARRAQVALEGADASEADIIAALLTDDAGEPLFATGAAMLEAVKALRPQDEWAKAQAEAQMAEAYPSTLEGRAKLKALLENGLRKYTGDRILREQRELAKRAGDEGPGVPLEAYKRAADELVAKKLVTAISPTRALQRERTAAKRKAEAAAKGDWAAAKSFGEQQLLNQQIHRAMFEAREERAAFENQLTRLGKRSAQETLGKADAEYQDAVNFVLEALGEREPSQSRPITDLPELGEWVQPVREALAKGVEQLTVADMRRIADALTWVYDAARDDVTALVDRQRFDKEETIAKLIAEAKANKKASVESYSSSESTQRSGSVAKDFAISLRNGLLKPETILSWLGGELMGKDWTDSTWFKAISKTFNDANVKSSDMLKSVTAPILELFEKMPAEVRAGFYESIDGKALFPNHAVRSGKNIDPPSTRFELVMMAANYGNPSNRYRLLTGRNISPAQMEKALALLTKPEIDFVNALHAAHETLRPMAFELEFRTKGIRPEGFEATPTTLPNGTLTGGYVPAVYDKRVEASARRNDEEIEEQIKTAAYGVAATKRGHLKSRVDGYYGAIRLDPDGLMAKIHQTVHDISFREAVRSVGGLLFDDRITDLLEQHLGKGGGSVMQDWVKAVASPQEVRGADSMSDFASFAKSFKGNMVFNALAYSLPNFIEDQSNFVTALNGSDIKTTQLASAMARMVASPFETYAAVEAKSDAIRVANDARVREVSKFMKQLKPTFWQKNAITGPLARNKYVAGLFDRIEDNGFALMEWSFKMTATPVFMGRYNQALEAGETEARAVEIADALVRRIFPSHGTINSSSVARNKTFAMLAMFDGFMSSMRNVGFTEGQRIIEGSAKEKARGAGRIVGLILSLGAVSAFLRGRGPDDDESWAHWLLRKSVVTPIDFMVPMLGPAMGAGVDALMSDKPLRARGGYTSDYVQNAYKLAQQAKKTAEGEGDPVKAIEALVRLGAPMTKLPTTQGLRIAKPLFGDEERDAADITSGLIYGESKAKPLNPVNIFSPTRPVPPLLQ